MAFQRSYSKVWWGSDYVQQQQQQLQPQFGAAPGSSLTSGGYYSNYLTQPNQHMQQRQQFGGGSAGYHSLDSNYNKAYTGNLSRIQEVDDEQNISTISWEKHDSPGSLRSQDSGFSDNDESHNARSSSGRFSHANSPSSSKSECGSPSSSRSVVTPPTVVRRSNKTEYYSPLVNVSRRISFSGSPAAAKAKAALNSSADEDGSQLMAKLDSIQLINDSSASLQQLDSSFEADPAEGSGAEGSAQKRRRRVNRKVTKPLTPTKRRIKLNSSEECETQEDISVAEMEKMAAMLRSEADFPPAYNNETVYLGEAPPPYNNETVMLGAAELDASNSVELQDNENNNTLKYEDMTLSPLKEVYVHHLNQKSVCFANNTSTPKAAKKATHVSHAADFENPLLNGHAPALQHWLKELRMSYDHEVMSTLQTKSIAQEAFKNLTITTNTVAKLIRQLQQRALYMQTDFERLERILRGEQSATLHDALVGAEQLLDNVSDFTQILVRRGVFFNDNRNERKRFEQNLTHIQLTTKDTRYSLARQHYINLESLLDDLQVLKRYLLITLRLVFEKLVGIIVRSIENNNCDLMLRANINMIATLTNIDYEGFASLIDAFVQNEAVRTLLLIVLEHKLSSVRALALRALATICCAPSAIAQLCSSGGMELIRDILQQPNEKAGKRGDVERREAVSLLTQITAAWHGPTHHVVGLRACAESIVAGISNLIADGCCAQSLLLCAASLNNLSRIEVTSHYSIMSNEAIAQLLLAVSRDEAKASIFLYEQIVFMLYNMAQNKKCHSHLANDGIINFITSVYETEFYREYETRAESDAQRRTIKAILHMLMRLVHSGDPTGGLAAELLEQQRMPAFLKMAVAAAAGNISSATLLENSQQSRELSLLAHQLLQAQKEQQQQQYNQVADSQKSTALDATDSNDSQPKSAAAVAQQKPNRQESYV